MMINTQTTHHYLPSCAAVMLFGLLLLKTSISPAQTLDLVLDDGSAEADIGFGNPARFLWFNQFDIPVDGFVLNQIQVLFPNAANVTAGSPINLVVYRDTDANPANGAELLLNLTETIRIADGTTFSSYDLSTPLTIDNASHMLIGVINRFGAAGMLPLTFPAALDQSSVQGNSWLAIWNAEPPATPDLPADAITDRVANVIGGGGNWLIRASGNAAAAPIPSVSAWGLVVLALLLGVIGIRRFPLR